MVDQRLLVEVELERTLLGFRDFRLDEFKDVPYGILLQEAANKSRSVWKASMSEKSRPQK